MTRPRAIPSGPRSLQTVTWIALLALFAARPVHAWDFGFSWGDCVDHGTTGVPNQSFACDFNYDPPMYLVLWMDPFTDMPNVTSIYTGIVFESSEAGIPDWWQIGAGGCRSGFVTIDLTPPPGTTCPDTWGGQAVGSFEVNRTAYCQPNEMAWKIVVQVQPGLSVALHHGTIYPLFRLRIAKDRSSGSGACAGCASGACFAVNSIAIGNSDGLGWSTSGLENASWQGASCAGAYLYCPFTPVRAATWGAIKSIYR